MPRLRRQSRLEMCNDGEPIASDSGGGDFDLTAEYIPELLRPADERLQRLAAGLPAESPAIREILHSRAGMKNRAQAAVRMCFW